MNLNLKDLLGKLSPVRRDRWAAEPEELDHIDNLSPMRRVRELEPAPYQPRHRRTR